MRPIGEADEDGRVDERPRHLPLHLAQDLLVDEEPPEDLLHLAGALARLQRRRVEAREDVAVRQEGVGEAPSRRRAAP